MNARRHGSAVDKWLSSLVVVVVAIGEEAREKPEDKGNIDEKSRGEEEKN